MQLNESDLIYNSLQNLLLVSGDFFRKKKGLSLLAALVKDPGGGRNPDMSYWETQVMEEGEQKEKVVFLFLPCWRQQELGKDRLHAIHQEKTFHQKVSKKNSTWEKKQQGAQPRTLLRGQ